MPSYELASEKEINLEPTEEAKEEFYSWVQKAAEKRNKEAEKIPEEKRQLVPFENIGFIEQIRPQEGEKMYTDNLFVCDFDDTIFDTTGYHEAIAKKCSELGVSREEWFKVYEESKIQGENEPGPLYQHEEHIRRLQALYPEFSDGIEQAFKGEPLNSHLDKEILEVLNLVAARSDSRVMILTHGALKTQGEKLGKAPELARYASLIAYTQVPKKEFLEHFLDTHKVERDHRFHGGAYGHHKVGVPHLFLLDDSPTELSNFTSLGNENYFQALRLRLPRAKRFNKEQTGEKVLETTELEARNYGTAIYRAFLGFVQHSGYFAPGGNFKETTLFASERKVDARTFRSAEKCFQKLPGGEILNWPGRFAQHGIRHFRFNDVEQKIEQLFPKLEDEKPGWGEQSLDVLLNDADNIF